MEFVDVGSVKDGDKIAWHFPSGISDTCGVHRIRGWGESIFYNAPYVDFVADNGQFRAIALPFVTHLNGRRVDRKYWSGRLPGLNLQVDMASSDFEERNYFGIQAILPLTEEDVKLADKLKTSTRKSLDEMSESHRAHIEKWEPHIENLGAEHVWVSANRFSGRGGEGPVYVGIKRGAKDYAIVDYDTEKMTKVTKSKVLEDGFESSKTMMEAFKEYRKMAKAERGDDRATKKKAAKPSTKAKSSTAAKKATTKKKAAAASTKKKSVAAAKRKRAPSK